MMDSLVDLYVRKFNSLINDVNNWNTYTADLFIVVKASVKTAILLDQTDRRRMEHTHAAHFL